MANDSNNNVEVYLLGKPQIKINNEKAHLPYKKVEAIFYYLILEKEVSKIKLADIFWGDKYDEDKSMKSLRNALHVIRKIFGKDFFYYSSQSLVRLNPDYSIKIDVESLNMEQIDDLQEKRFCFLEDHYLKDSELYNEWIELNRQKIRNLIMNELIKKIDKNVEKRNFILAEKLCFELIGIDIFDERGYRLLIELYRNNKMYNKAIKIYNKLEKLLMEELLISPDEEIQKIVLQVKEERNREITDITNSKKNDLKYIKDKRQLFYGRKNEKEIINKYLNNFLYDIKTKSLMIIGEEGIGKSRLAEEILQNYTRENNYDLFKTQCYRAEEKYLLKPWQDIFNQMMSRIEKKEIEIPDNIANSIVSIFPFLKPNSNNANYDFYNNACPNYSDIENSIVNLLLTIYKNRKLIIYFDDIQWSDEESLSLISNLLISDKNKNIFFIFTSRLERKKILKTFTFDMNKNGFISKVMLKRFNFSETIELVQKLVPNFEFDDDMKRIFYNETEGNPFYIIEISNNIKQKGSFEEITPNIKDVLENRLLSINDGPRKILDLMAIFFDKITYELLLKLSNVDEYELVENIEVLANRNFIYEKGNINDTYYVFTHQKIREYVYSEMSLSKKRILHCRAAQIFESRLENNSKDLLLYSKLIYHFEKSGDINKYLIYNIKYLYGYSCREHEFFPVLQNTNFNTIYKTKQRNIEDEFNRISQKITDNRKRNNTDLNIETFSEYLHMVGRFYIRKGEYKKGIKYISELKNINLQIFEKDNFHNIIKANRQYMCIYINNYDLKGMKNIIDESLEIISKFGDIEEIAIWYRLFGLYEIMMGRTNNGEKFLKKAIEIFEKSSNKDKYLVNLAVSYGWIGEAKRLNMKYEEAIKYFDKAIDLCENKGLIGGLQVFYVNAGQALFDKGNYSLAEEYLIKSIECYKQTDLLWERSFAYSYYSLVLITKNRFSESIEYIKKARDYSMNLKSPYEQGVVYRILAQIKSMFPYNNDVRTVFKELVDKDMNYYLDESEKLLDKVFSPIDKKLIKKMRNNKKISL